MVGKQVFGGGLKHRRLLAASRTPCPVVYFQLSNWGAALPNQTLIENIMYKSGYFGKQVIILSFLPFINILKMVQAIDQRAINTVRVLAADVVRGANSGHPGTILLLFNLCFPGVQKKHV